jgi:hypothetical protein
MSKLSSPSSVHFHRENVASANHNIATIINEATHILTSKDKPEQGQQGTTREIAFNLITWHPSPSKRSQFQSSRCTRMQDANGSILIIRQLEPSGVLGPAHQFAFQAATECTCQQLDHCQPLCPCSFATYSLNDHTPALFLI